MSTKQEKTEPETHSSEKSRGKTKSASSSKAPSKPPVNLDESMGVVLASNWNPSGECTVLIQIDPEDSAALELEGSQGVVGRIETDEQGGTDSLVVCMDVDLSEVGSLSFDLYNPLTLIVVASSLGSHT